MICTHSPALFKICRKEAPQINLVGKYKYLISDTDLYFNDYINLVEDIFLFDAFDNSLKKIELLGESVLEAKGNIEFEMGKWTIKQILQHIIDWERKPGYCALAINITALGYLIAGHQLHHLKVIEGYLNPDFNKA